MGSTGRSLADTLSRLAGKVKLERVLDDRYENSDSRVVAIGQKPDACYKKYIIAQLEERDVQVIHIRARGPWIRKAARLSRELVRQGRLNVFRVDVAEVCINDRPSHTAIITLVVSDVLPKTSPDVWLKMTEVARVHRAKPQARPQAGWADDDAS